jgi:hypothetical protein
MIPSYRSIRRSSFAVDGRSLFDLDRCLEKVALQLREAPDECHAFIGAVSSQVVPTSTARIF